MQTIAKKNSDSFTFLNAWHVSVNNELHIHVCLYSKLTEFTSAATSNTCLKAMHKYNKYLVYFHYFQEINTVKTIYESKRTWRLIISAA
jgi:hypothetical protein